MEAHQHASLVGFSVQCGAFTLMPLKSSQCPSMAETEELPACRASLGLNAVCEADVEVRDACSKEVMLSREQRMMTMILHMRTCGLTPVNEQSTS